MVVTIGQAAKATGVAAKTIRYYEEIGVLPMPSRTDAGYRQYTEQGVQQLQFIRRARALGLPLHRLKALAALNDGGPRTSMRPRLLEVVRAHLATVRQRMRELARLYLTGRGNASPETVGFVVSLSVLGRLVALWLGGGVSDRWGRMHVLIPGLLAYAALLGSLTFLTHPVVLGFWSLGIGAAAGFVAPLPTALIGDTVRPPMQGVAIGWLRTVTDTGQILGPLVMGALADAVDLTTPFLFGATLLMVTAWQCRRRADAISAAVATGRGGS